MRKLLLVSAALGALCVPALADNITLTATADGVLVDTISSGGLPTLDENNVAFGSAFNLNSLTINSEASLSPGDILSTNTINVAANASGQHNLVLDITSANMTGLGSLENFLSSFSVTGLPAGWSVQETTFINGVQLAQTPNFMGPPPSDSAFSTDAALMTNPFSAEVQYNITSNGAGRFNGGIDLSVAPVPGPLVGAGLPGLLAGLTMIGFFGTRRQKVA